MRVLSGYKLTVFFKTVSMEDHIRELLNRYHYSEEVKEAVAFRVLFDGEDVKQIIQELGIHSIQTIHYWVSAY